MGKVITLDMSMISDKQRRFMEAKTRYVAYGGARGGGKSWAVRMKATLLALNWPGIKLLIVRRTYPELVNNHIDPLRMELNGIAKYAQTRKAMTFANGSTIRFGYCNNDADMLQYQGAEYDVVFIDEAAQLKKEWLDAINVTVRGTNGFPKRTYYTLNPGGPSHDYFRRLFVNGICVGAEKPEDYTFIQARVEDNAALMQAQPEYVESLRNLPEARRRAWLEGDWNAYEGQFFSEFRDNPDGYRTRQYTHVIEPFAPDPGWKICRSYDFGFGKPFSCAWWAVDYEGVIYRILELYGCRDNEPNTGLEWNPDVQFAKIAQLEKEHPWLAGKQITGVADPSIWDASRGESVAQTAARYRVYFTPGDNKRIPGWMQCHYRLQFDGDGYPRMYVFSNCKAFIRTIPLLVYDQHKAEDLDTTMEDHCLVGGTMVLTEHGYRTLESLVGTNGRVISSDGRLHRYADVRRTRKDAEILEIELEDGTKIQCTDDHRFMLPNGGWIRAGDLSAGMEVKTHGSSEDQRDGTEV